MRDTSMIKEKRLDILEIKRFGVYVPFDEWLSWTDEQRYWFLVSKYVPMHRG